MSDELHLSNHNFMSSLKSSLWSLLTTSSLCDCTLVCSDGQVSAHKIILAASSAFFSSVFSLHPHSNPLIYMRGVTMEEVSALLHYIYQGSTVINKKDLPTFFQLAQDLKIDGLTKTFEKGEDRKSPDNSNLMNAVKHLGKYETKTIDDDEIMSSCKKEKDEEGISDGRRKKRKVSCTKVSDEYKVSDNEKVTASKESDFFPNHGSSHLIKDILTREVSNGDTDEGVDPCAEHDRLFNPAEGKSKLDYVLDDVDDSSVTNFPTIFPKVFCPVCNKMDGMSLDLQQHMKAKRDVQCEICKLNFSNCNTLKVHLDGRCKFGKKKIN